MNGNRSRRQSRVHTWVPTCRFSTLYNPEGEEETSKVFRNLLTTKGVGIVVVDSAVLSALPERLRDRLSESVTPTVLGIGTEEDTTLRETIRKAIGVDLWK